MMLWGSIWTSMFVSTLMSIFNLEEVELKAMNLFHRIDLRRLLETVAAKVVTDLVKLNKMMIMSYKINQGQDVK